MKRYIRYTVSLLIAVLLMPAFGLAANKEYFSLLEPAALNGRHLKAGNYEVSWTGNGPNAELNVSAGGKVLATSPAQLVPVDHAPAEGSVLLSRNPDGSMFISEIRFGGKKYRLIVSPPEPPNGRTN
jgi:hypothetical protein